VNTRIIVWLANNERIYFRVLVICFTQNSQILTNSDSKIQPFVVNIRLLGHTEICMPLEVLTEKNSFC